MPVRIHMHMHMWYVKLCKQTPATEIGYPIMCFCFIAFHSNLLFCDEEGCSVPLWTLVTLEFKYMHVFIWRAFRIRNAKRTKKNQICYSKLLQLQYEIIRLTKMRGYVAGMQGVIPSPGEECKVFWEFRVHKVSIILNSSTIKVNSLKCNLHFKTKYVTCFQFSCVLNQ